MVCSKEQGTLISLIQTAEEQDAYMIEFDRIRSQLKESKESKSKDKKDKLLQKRKRDDAGLEIGEGKVKSSELNKRQRIDDKSETYKSLFIKSST